MPFKKGNQFGGRRKSRLSAAPRTPIPKFEDEASDEEMIDGDEEADEPRDATPQDDEEAVEEEEAATPAQDEDEEDDEDAPPTITTLPRRRGGRARGGARRSTRADKIDYGTPLPLDADEGSESGTPFRRRRGRPDGSGRPRGRGGFRGRRKGQKTDLPPVVIDKDGNALDVMNDDVQVDYDEEGQTKVDDDGVLQGGREYRVRTFKILGKDERLYMLSTEPARCCGFRDSYLFFTKHPKLYKVLLDEDQKKDLIDRDILPSSYKGRNIGVVTARSVFREFGARIVVGGRRITDDYKVAEAKANGEVEGELADPNDSIPDNKEDYNRNRYVAWFGASEVYRTVGQGTQQTGKPGPMGKRRNITVENWQSLHSREAGRFNSALAQVRRSTLDGVYDTHTNMMFYPTIMQPTHARWEQAPPPPAPSDTKLLMNGLMNGHKHMNGTTEHNDHDSAMDIEDIPRSQESPLQSTIFSDVPPTISRNFAVIDTHYTEPPVSGTGYPGPDGHTTDPTSGPNGLSSISSDLLDELPEDCRRAFEEAKRTELQWKKQWGTEAHSAMRAGLRIGFNGYPV